MENSNLVLNNTHFISSYARDVLKSHMPHVCDDQLFRELEDMCKFHVQKRMRDYNIMLQKKAELSKTAESVIERIENYFNYSLHKNNHKMRLTRKEYEYSMGRLEVAERMAVEKWLDDNGGLDKYIFSGYTAQ